MMHIFKKCWRQVTRIALILLCCLMFAACAAGQAQPDGTIQPDEQVQPVEANAPADTVAQETGDAPGARFRLTGFTADDLEGNAVTETVFADHAVTMVNIWGTFCGPCLGEMPDLGVLSQEYVDKGLQIIGIVADVEEGSGDVDSVRTIVEQTKANYTHLLVSPTLESKLLKDVIYVPTTYFFDAEGYQLGDAVVGSKSKSEWQALMDDVLESAAQ